jgi:hypothetical protein
MATPKNVKRLPAEELANLNTLAREVFGQQGEETISDSLGRTWVIRVDRAPYIALFIGVTALPNGPKKIGFAQEIRVPGSAFGADAVEGDALSLAFAALDAAAADAMA